ncbi:hypothetical protein FRB90_008986 [Tulasnella sp. 427]|nr:hypothetical protein FRB90_008986 [Tulasnella sp. 427]
MYEQTRTDSDHREIWEELAVQEYLREELVFFSKLVLDIAQKHPDWKSKPSFHNDARHFFGVVFGALNELKERAFPIAQEQHSRAVVDENDYNLDDRVDSVYEEPWMPTSLYRWLYRTQYYDPIFYDSDSEFQYPSDDKPESEDRTAPPLPRKQERRGLFHP